MVCLKNTIKKERNMKKLLLPLVTLVLVVACSSSNNEELSVAREGSPPNQVVEYVWHYKDANFSEENLNMLIDKWNSMIDSRDYEMNGANILFPRGESAADFIWVMLWPSMEARDAAWDDWMNNLDEDWQNLINGIMKVDFDNVYAFKPTVKRTASVPNQSSYFENEFNFCNYNEGYGENDLQQFETNFNTFLDETELNGLPDNYKKERLQKSGKYAIDMSYPSYRPFMTLAESDDAREKLRFMFNNRAVDTNIEVLDNIIRTRMDLVKLLGYRSYADYRTEDRMAKNAKNVWAFEKDLKVKLRDKAKKDLVAMMALKSKRTGNKLIFNIQPWESDYYENKIKLERFNLDSEEVRQYFEFNNVTEGLFKIYQLLFGVRFEKVKNASVWHEDVQMFSIFNEETNELIGNFYLDMFPRANKYSHAAAFSVVMGKRTDAAYQKPSTALVCNFPKPTEFQPSLLTHDNVETYFHEFGHLVHGVLTKSDLMLSLIHI